MKRASLTPSQRLWAELFGLLGIPELDEGKVLSIVDSLPAREGLVVRLRFGFGSRPLTLEKVGGRLPRTSGGMGVSREIVRRELERALKRLRHPRRWQAWQDARRSQGG